MNACIALCGAQGMSYIDDSMMAQLMGHYLDESSVLKAALHCNAAAALLALRRHEEALDQCRGALALEPGNVKALYRKGRAHAGLGQDGAAREALERAAKLAPGDAAVRAALRELDAEERAKAQAAKGLFTGLFGGTAEPGGGEEKRVEEGESNKSDTVSGGGQHANQAPPPPLPRRGLLGRLSGLLWGAADP